MDGTYWTNKEIMKLEELYPNSSHASLLEEFPDRTLCSLYHKARKLGLLRIYALRWKKSDETLNLSVAEAAYIAGIVDGEGCINIYLRGRDNVRTPQVFITNTDKAMLGAVQAMIKGKGSIRVHCKSGKGSDGCNRKESYRLWLTNMDDMRQVLEAIEPYLIIKKEKTQIMLKLLEDRDIQSYEKSYHPIKQTIPEMVVAS